MFAKQKGELPSKSSISTEQVHLPSKSRNGLLPSKSSIPQRTNDGLLPIKLSLQNDVDEKDHQRWLDAAFLRHTKLKRSHLHRWRKMGREKPNAINWSDWY